MDVIALVISFLALAVSAVALFQSDRFRKGDIGMEVGRLKAEIESQLQALEERVPKVKASWHALFAANGTLHSGMREAMDRELDRALTEVATLRARLSEIDGAGGDAKPREATVVELWSVKMAAGQIEADITDREERHRRGVESRQQGHR
ncbi:MAG: hypothetical protein ACP5DC_09950 [Halothiobacillaceae bacterium]